MIYFSLFQMNRDIQTHYNGMFPDKHFWPEPVPNGPFPEMFESPNPFTYTFCWHAEAAFSVWHRALTLEFERELQTFDPANGGHCGYQALGLHYWAWSIGMGKLFLFSSLRRSTQ